MFSVVRGSSRVRGLGLGLALALASSSLALADEIVVKGDRLRGTVKAVTATGIEFETVYGKGSVTIPHEEISEIRTDGTYLFVHGDEGETRGKIVGVEKGVVLVGESPGGAERVQMEQIQLVIGEAAIEESPIAAMKGKLRYWSGNFDLGFSLAQGTTDTQSLNLDLGAERRKGRTRFVFDSGLIYGTQKRIGEQSTTTADQIYGDVRGEYDLTQRLFGYGDGYLEYNGIQRLSLRGVPGAGLGYKFWKSAEKDSKDFFAGTLGGSWVYEKYFGGDHRDYIAVAFGAETLVTLPYGSTVSGTVQYLPAVTDFTNDFLIRSQAALTIPVWKQLAFKFSIADDYDNTPAPGSTFNYLTTTVAASLQL